MNAGAIPTTSSPGARRALPGLLLLPAALLAWPLPAVLADDPFPHLAGAGWVCLASIPTAALLAFAPRREDERVRGLSLLALVWAFVAAWVLARAPADEYEARRALALASAWPALFLGGAMLDAWGRRLFNRGLVLLSILWVGAAFLSSLETEELGGVLGNTGPLSQAALPGAVIGAWYVATRRGLFRLLGALACGLFLAHVALAPVHAGGAAFLVVLLASTLLSPWARSRVRVRRSLGILAALAVFVPIALRGDAPSAESAREDRAQADGEARAGDRGDLGGVEVRLLTWRRIPRLLRDHPAFGVGPGQFQRSFPPYRDPDEIERSRAGDCDAGIPEVDHAHNDYLQGLAELGLAGGGLWVLLLAFAARAALRGLGGADFTTISMSAAALALLVAGCFHSALSFQPASSAIGFVLFGAVLARDREHVGLRAGRWIARAALVVALAGALWAVPLVAHGRALAAYVAFNRAGDAPGAVRALQAVRESHPGSAPARLLALQIDRSPEALDAALLARPNDVNVLAARGFAFAILGETVEARRSWERALELAPGMPIVLRNLTELEYHSRNDARAREYLAALRAGGCATAPWTAAVGTELVLAGRWQAGARVLYDASLEELSPEILFAEADEGRREASRVLAHLAWARDQVADEDYRTAVRSYRQVLAPTKVLAAEGAPAARAELIAAYLLAGRSDDARAESAGFVLDEPTRSELPEWARSELARAGL